MNKKNGQLSVYVCIHVKIMNTLITVINPRCHEGNSCWREDEGFPERKSCVSQASLETLTFLILHPSERILACTTFPSVLGAADAC